MMWRDIQGAECEWINENNSHGLDTISHDMCVDGGGNGNDEMKKIQLYLGINGYKHEL